ncbi:MAG: hypothetical protein JW715_05585 [Sedimentisphaerales bacterium]|nr:hypothetical protein [Sedimentisphaerales bacterium]
MRTRNFTVIIIAAIIFAGLFAGSARADKQQLQEKLSKDIGIRLSDVTISNALDSIGQKAGVKIVLSDEAVWKLPYGEATRLSVSLSGPLADSLTEMLNAFFMRYAVGEEEVTIYPRPELEHILGRPSTKQLELLKAIYTKTINVYYLEQVQKSVNEAIGEVILISPIEVHAQLNNFLRQLVGKDAIFQKIDARLRQPQNVAVRQVREQEPNEPEQKEYLLPTPVTLVQLLNQVDTGNGAEYTKWYISGMDFPGQTPEVHVINNNEFRTLRLKQKIDISYKEQSLDKIFQDLASRAGVPLVVMPGSQLHEHALSASMQNIEIHQAVRNIADMAGVGCDIRDSIMLELRDPVPAKTRTVNKKDSGKILPTEGYVGKISIPMEGGKYFIEFMLRESDLTTELKKLRDEKMKEVLDQEN